MKKVFLLAALVLACTAGSNASAMNEAALNASMSELMPVKKKTTKKIVFKEQPPRLLRSQPRRLLQRKHTSAYASNRCNNYSMLQQPAMPLLLPVQPAMQALAVAGILGAVLGGNSNGSSSAGSSIINGILNNVIGSGTFSKQDLCAHTWKYSKPGCAFTSENLLAKAGGEIAANKVEEKLGELLQQVWLQRLKHLLHLQNRWNFRCQDRWQVMAGQLYF